jgi:hypothetical protein
MLQIRESNSQLKEKKCRGLIAAFFSIILQAVSASCLHY